MCSKAGDLQTFNANQLWTIVGQWTPAVMDCAKYLNWRGVSTHYDGTRSGSPHVGSCSGLTRSGSLFSSTYKVITYEKASGWIMWTWKVEQVDEWSYRAGLKASASGWHSTYSNSRHRSRPAI
ncbi:hypothetical protein H4582DRAFT_2146532 [Lactarius indigo]|nr:hypothetical protein H4582DRAFT_2146532 [Lactarius indigo]